MSEDRALTIWQPWANLVMSGIKDVENRSWPVPSTLPPFCVTNHSQPVPRGDNFTDDPQPCRCGPFPFRLWIHAGKTHDHMACLRHAQAVWNEPTVFGALLGSVLVTGCHDSDTCMEPNGVADAEGLYHDWRFCSPWADGDFGVYHWTLADPQPLPEPIPMKGRQGLWRIPHNVGGFLVGSSPPSIPSTSAD